VITRDNNDMGTTPTIINGRPAWECAAENIPRLPREKTVRAPIVKSLINYCLLCISYERGASKKFRSEQSGFFGSSANYQLLCFDFVQLSD